MRAILLGTLAASICLVVHAWHMSPYTDPIAKSRWDDRASDALESQVNSKEFEQFKQQYFPAVDALRTSRNTLMDLGLGLGALSFMLLLGCASLGVRRWVDLAKTSSPSRTWRFYVVGNLFWLALIPAGFVIYLFRSVRGDYAWFADSIAIPIFAQAFVVVAALPLINLFLATAASRGTHPARLFSLFPQKSPRNLLLEVLFAVLGLTNLLVIGTMFITGDFVEMPTSLVFLYLLLSARAGLINRQKLQTPAESQADSQTYLAEPARP